MEKKIILQDVAKTFDDLIRTIGTVEAQSFNQVPFEGSWTAGQVVEHLNLSNGGFTEVIDGEVADSNRPADEKIIGLKAVFLNFDLKMQSPPFILPEVKAYDRDGQLLVAEGVKAKLIEQINTLPLDQSCISFELPQMGFLTRLEAIYFVVYHTQRHTHQLQYISEALKLS